jgi:hypothetical protein
VDVELLVVLTVDDTDKVLEIEDGIEDMLVELDVDEGACFMYAST